MNCRRCNTPIPSRSSSCPNCGQQVGPGESFIDDPGASGVFDADSSDENALGPSTLADPYTDAPDAEIDLEDEAELSLEDAVAPERPARPKKRRRSTHGETPDAKRDRSTAKPARKSVRGSAREPRAARPRPEGAASRKRGASSGRPRRAKAASSARGARHGSGSGLLPSTDTVRAIISQHPELIEPGLEVLTDESGSEIGVDHPTDVGVIDLLARDEAGVLVAVIVVEPGHPGDIVAESLHRLGWVRKHLAKSGEDVRGIVLTESLDEQTAYAAAAVAGTLRFKSYALSLSLVDLDV